MKIIIIFFQNAENRNNGYNLNNNGYNNFLQNTEIRNNNNGFNNFLQNTTSTYNNYNQVFNGYNNSFWLQNNDHLDNIYNQDLHRLVSKTEGNLNMAVPNTKR